MDSLTHVALGASVAMAAMGRRTTAWRAAAWGAIACTLPDLDTFIRHGDAVRDMTFHRAESHSLFWLALASPLLGGLAARWHDELDRWRRWWLAMALALLVHPLLDLMTVYGTQLLLPFTDRPYGMGSIFIIDPLYTLPLLAGVGAALAWPQGRGPRWNRWGLALSTAYLAWGLAAQAWVRGTVEDALAAQGRQADRMLVTPTPFNSLLWRVVVLRPDGHEEAFVSLLDGGRPPRFERHGTDKALEGALQEMWTLQRMAWFTHGFYRVHQRGGYAFVTDLRMGQEPHYTFSFRIARRQGREWVPVLAQNRGSLPPDLPAAFGWLGRRLLGEDLPPPR